MTDTNTAVREKKEEEKAKRGIAAYAKALGVLVSPVLIYFLQDMYVTMKSMNENFAVLRTEVSEMRDREMDTFRRNLVNMKRDMDQLKIQIGIMEGLYDVAPWTWEDEEAYPEDPGVDRSEMEALRREIERLQEERDYYEEFDDYEQMEQQQQQYQQKK
jgi:hypothetical protein